MLQVLFVALILLGAAHIFPADAEAIVVYFNDFQGVVGGEWSSSSTDSTPLPAGGSRKFLGRFADGTVTLTLGGLPAHSDATVEFDLYIIQSWDGDGPEPGTPDVWTLAAGGGPTLLHTTFSNFPDRTQDYPGQYDDVPGGATNPPKTGAVESNTLGYGGFLDFPGGDAVYHLAFTFPHADGSLVLNFTGGPGLTSVPDESWGLDNVSVSVNGQVGVPEPAAVLLLGAALFGLALGRSRRRR